MLEELEGAARYAGLLLAPAESFDRGLFLPFGFFLYYFYILVIVGDQEVLCIF